MRKDLELNGCVSPCFDCKERVLKCHSTCEKYKAYRQEVDAVNAKRDEKVQTGVSYNMYRMFALDKYRRAKKWKS
jgi:hypothetical protein